MGFDWMRVLDTVSDLALLASGRGRNQAPSPDTPIAPQAGGAFGQFEARLTGVLVAALKEVFERDNARLELERAQQEAERRRADELLRAEMERRAAELRLQAADRTLAQLRLIALLAVGLWALSAVLVVVLPGMREGVAPRVLIGLGWVLSLGTVGGAFAGWQRITAWSADGGAGSAAPPEGRPWAWAPWLLLGAIALTAAGLLAAL